MDAQQRHMRISTWLCQQPSFAHLLFPALLPELPFPLLLALLLRGLPAALLHKAVEQHLAITQALLDFDHFQFQAWPDLHARVAINQSIINLCLEDSSGQSRDNTSPAAVAAVATVTVHTTCPSLHICYLFACTITQ